MTEFIHPFSLVASPRYFYLAPQYIDVLKHAISVVQNREGLGIIAGPVGSGKSTLIRYLIDALSEAKGDKLNILYVPNPTFTGEFQLIKHLCLEAGLPPKATKYEQTEVFRDWLVAQHAEGKNTCVIIDEAHRLNGRMLEIARELFNYSTNDTFLCQVILAGEEKPFKQKLKMKPAIVSRALYYDTLGPLRESEVAELLRFRLRVTNLPQDFFTDEQVRELHIASRGNPREVVKLAREFFDKEALVG